jgi:hypothetical protein
MKDQSAAEPFNRAQRIIQEAILSAYPNPERHGCPGEAVLRRLAAYDSPLTDDPAWDHVTHCSPCYAEFLVLSNNKKSANRRARLQRRTVLAAAALILIGFWLFFRFKPEQFPQQARRKTPVILASATPRPAYLEFEPPLSRRASPAPENSPGEPLRLPLANLDLTLALPPGGSPGPYQLEIREQPAGSPLVSANGLATVDQQRVLLKTRINLTALKKGSYSLAVRLANSEWTVVPVDLN